MHETLWFCLVSGLNISDGVLGLCSVSLQVDKSVCLLDGDWNKQVYNKYTFTARLLGC